MVSGQNWEEGHWLSQKEVGSRTPEPLSQASIFCPRPIAHRVARTCPVDLLVHGKGVGDLAERGRK